MFEQRVRTTQVREHIGDRIRVAGFIHTLRRMSKMAFMVLRDGWGTVQVVLEPRELDRLKAEQAGPGSVIALEATAVAQVQARGGVELTDARVAVVVPISGAFPVPLGRGLESAKLGTQLDHAPTVLRDPTRRAALRLAAATTAAFRNALTEQGFTEIHTPRLVAGATEGGANVFGVDYFGQPVYLAQSPQLYKQMMVGVFDRVFEVGPVFRAEPHATVRHLAEYTSLDVEMGFIESHLDVAQMLGLVLRRIVHDLKAKGAELGELPEVAWPRIPDPLPRLQFSDARRRLAEAGVGPLEGDDLAPAEERWLGDWAGREYQSDVLLVTGYPLAKRPFYTHPDADEAGASASFDLLFRGTELVTGGQRLHRYDDIAAAIEGTGADRDAFAGYLEAFRYGMPPHGGFAIGLERFVTQLLGLPNIRLARAFPRNITRTQP